MAQLKAHASQLEEQARGAESRVTQLQSRVTEMEAQLRVTTDQLRVAQQRAEEAQAAPEVDPTSVPAPIQEKLDDAAEMEQVLRDELEVARAETQRVEHELEALVQATRRRRDRRQGSSIRSARTRDWPRKSVNGSWPRPRRVRPPTRCRRTPSRGSRSSRSSSNVRKPSGRCCAPAVRRPSTKPGTASSRTRSRRCGNNCEGPGLARCAAPGRGVDSGAIAALEERLAAAEERARDAERRLDEAKPPRSRSRASRRERQRERRRRTARRTATGTGSVDEEPEATIKVKPRGRAAGRRHGRVDDGPPADGRRQRAAEQVGPQHGCPTPWHLDPHARRRPAAKRR